MLVVNEFCRTNGQKAWSSLGPTCPCPASPPWSVEKELLRRASFSVSRVELRPALAAAWRSEGASMRRLVVVFELDMGCAPGHEGVPVRRGVAGQRGELRTGVAGHTVAPGEENPPLLMADRSKAVWSGSTRNPLSSPLLLFPLLLCPLLLAGPLPVLRCESLLLLRAARPLVREVEAEVEAEVEGWEWDRSRRLGSCSVLIFSRSKLLSGE